MHVRTGEQSLLAAFLQHGGNGFGQFRVPLVAPRQHNGPQRGKVSSRLCRKRVAESNPDSTTPTSICRRRMSGGASPASEDRHCSKIALRLRQSRKRDIFLVVEIAVDGGFADLRFLGNVLHRHFPVAVPFHQAHGGVQNGFTHVRGAATRGILPPALLRGQINRIRNQAVRTAPAFQTRFRETRAIRDRYGFLTGSELAIATKIVFRSLEKGLRTSRTESFFSA